MEYLPIDPGDTIINCGVFEGFEIPFFLAFLRGKGTIHNIDPMGDDFLNEYVKKTIKNFPEMVQMHKLAFHNATEEIFIPISSGGQANGKQATEIAADVANQSSIRALGIRPIDFVEQQGISKVDILKTDVEGAEEFIVPAFEPVIKKYRPKLAISIYHRTNHLWDLPIALMQMCENYRFYLNGYDWEPFEVVLYCIPSERDANPNRQTLSIKPEQDH